MEMKNYLKMLREDIHTTVMATVDGKGHPVTRVIDIMLEDGKTIYFITAKGKAFYRQLMEQKFISVSGFCGGEGMDKKEASIHMKAVSVRGTVRDIGTEMLDEIFKENPYMNEIYPDMASREALEVFCIAEGVGEYFDLATKPITREGFSVGIKGGHTGGEMEGYCITDGCTGCGKCIGVCPQKCIDTGHIPFRIRSENCLHCGNCMEACPSGAVEYKKYKRA